MLNHKILGCVCGGEVDIKEAGAGKKQIRVLLSESMCFVGDLKFKNNVTRKSISLNGKDFPYPNFCSVCIIPNMFVS